MIKVLETIPSNILHAIISILVASIILTAIISLAIYTGVGPDPWIQ